VLRAKDPKVQHARVCIMVAGLVLQGIAGSKHWPLDASGMTGLHACKTLVGIMKDVEESLDDVRDDLHGVRAKTEGVVEATTLGIKPSQA